MRGSISILPCMYQSTIFGTSVRPLAPPKAEPFQVLPVTSWKGRVEISFPAPAPPLMTETPQPLCAHSTAAQVHQVWHEVALDLVRVHEVGHAELLGQLLAGRVEVHAHDLVGSHHPRALDDVQPDAAEAKDHDVRSRLDLRGVHHRPDAGRHPAADIADLLEGGILPYLSHRYLR